MALRAVSANVAIALRKVAIWTGILTSGLVREILGVLALSGIDGGDAGAEITRAGFAATAYGS